MRRAHLDRRVDTGAHRITDLHALGSDDVATLAIGILQQCDVRRAVRIVFQALNDRRDTIFGPLEVDYTVVLLVTTTNVTSGNAASIVTATRLTLSFYQRLRKHALCTDPGCKSLQRGDVRQMLVWF